MTTTSKSWPSKVQARSKIHRRKRRHPHVPLASRRLLRRTSNPNRKSKIGATKPQHRSRAPSEIEPRNNIYRRKSQRYVKSQYATMSPHRDAPHQKIPTHIPNAPTNLVPHQPPPIPLAPRSRSLPSLASRGN